MQAGQLRHRITITRKTVTRDTAGDDRTDLGNWVTVAVLWANVAPMAGRELLISEQLQKDATVTVTVRYYPGVTVRDRVTHAGTLYDIADVRHIANRRRETQITMREVINA